MNDLENSLSWLLPSFAVVFPFMFVGMWCLILRFLSSASGWSRLASRFHLQDSFDGKRHHFQSANMNGVNFNSALVIGASPNGLYLSPVFLFRLFHPPLLIPWAEIQAEPVKQWWSTGYRLTFRSFPGIHLTLNDRTFDKIVAHLKENIMADPQPPPRG